jgi:hypothetical protein
MKKKTAKSKPAHRPQMKRAVRPLATPSEAQRLAATILEVLSGMRSPTEASHVLSISLPRYYQLEARALEGLVAALAPRSIGKQPSLENRVKLLEKQLAAAHRQCARHEALVRLTQRTLGFTAVTPAKSVEQDASGRKKRRPTVRALKAARALAERAEASAAGAGQVDLASLQPTAPDAIEEVRSCPA